MVCLLIVDLEIILVGFDDCCVWEVIYGCFVYGYIVEDDFLLLDWFMYNSYDDDFMIMLYVLFFFV